MPGELPRGSAQGRARQRRFRLYPEDDAVLSPGVQLILNERTLRGLPAFDVMRLQHDRAVFGLPFASVGNIELFVPFRSHGGAFAQIVTRAGAAKAAASLVPARVTVDYAMYGHAYVPRLLVVEVCPALAEFIRPWSIRRARSIPRECARPEMKSVMPTVRCESASSTAAPKFAAGFGSI